MESENEGKLPFMDVEVKKMGAELRRTVYCKPSFTGLDMRRDSFYSKLQRNQYYQVLNSESYEDLLAAGTRD